MSFQLNLSSLAIGAKDRLARLEASGGAIRSRLLSPLPGGVPTADAPGHSAVSFSSPPVGAARFSDPVADVEVGVSGEFSISGGGRRRPPCVCDDAGFVG